MSDTDSLTKKSMLIGAIAVLGASVGAVRTAYSDDSHTARTTPLELTGKQMDQVTAGTFKDGPGFHTPLIIRDNNAIQIKWDVLLPAVQHKVQEVSTDRVTFTDAAMFIKIGDIKGEIR